MRKLLAQAGTPPSTLTLSYSTGLAPTKLIATAVNDVWTQPDPQSDSAKAAYAAFTDILLDEQFVIDLVIGTNTNVYQASVQDVDWNLYKNLRLEKTYLA